MPAARGEKMVRSVPRSRWERSWPWVMLSRMSPSVMEGSGGGVCPAFSAATWAARQPSWVAGEVV